MGFAICQINVKCTIERSDDPSDIVIDSNRQVSQLEYNSVMSVRKLPFVDKAMLMVTWDSGEAVISLPIAAGDSK